MKKLKIEEIGKKIKDFYNMSFAIYKYTANGFIFYVNDICYYFLPCDFEENYLKLLLQLQQEIFLKGIKCHEFILNKKGEILSDGFVLLKVNVVIEEIDFDDVRAFHIPIDTKLYSEYVAMPDFWRKKIDYLEFQLSELSTSVLINNSFDYYLGVSELILRYLNDVPRDNTTLYLSHKEFKSLNSLDFYNPLYFTFDYYLRDVAHYIKLKNDFELLYSILDQYSFTKYEYAYFFARICFPFQYFNLLSTSLLNGEGEKELGVYLLQNKKYEDFLLQMEKVFGIYIFSWIQND